MQAVDSALPRLVARVCLSCALKVPRELRELFLAQNPESRCDVDFGNSEHIQAFPDTATL